MATSKPFSFVCSQRELAMLVGVTPSQIQKYLRRGMPIRPDRKIDAGPALRWIKDNIGPAWPGQVSDRR
jgi:hypothetical protein